ncbi:MAG: hypothetical protein Q9209_007492 [Squamulea sp. 1 TL-2023]
MRMPRPPEDDLHFNFFRAQHTAAYVERYLHEHRYDGLSLYDRIRFLFRVTRITRGEHQWEVQGDHGSETFHTSKVIVASGLASTPNMPIFPGVASFDAPIIHQKDFGQSSVLSDSDLHNVVVLGGGKSSADMVYACVKAGKSVTWIIRKTGGAGPGFLLSPEGKGPYKDALFWQNDTGGLLHKQDFWDVIGKNVRIHLEDITKVDKKLLYLSGEAEIPTDAILCGTGWSKTSFDFFDPQETVRLGLPHKFEGEKSEDLAEWSRYELEADLKIVAEFPMLAEAPKHFHLSPETTPYRLYKGIAPLGDTSIAFVGFTSVASYFRGVECQAIWATAYLDGKLALPVLEVQKERIARTIAWSKRRYLSNGELGNFFPFESNFYLDGLLEEVGLKSHLKGWFSHYFVPSKAQDLVGLKDEYITKYGSN